MIREHSNFGIYFIWSLDNLSSEIPHKKLSLSMIFFCTGLLTRGGARLHQIFPVSFHLFILCCHRSCHVSKPCSYSFQQHFSSLTHLIVDFGGHFAWSNQGYEPVFTPLPSPPLFSLTPPTLKTAKWTKKAKLCVACWEKKTNKQSAWRYTPSDKNWQKFSQYGEIRQSRRTPQTSWVSCGKENLF